MKFTIKHAAFLAVLGCLTLMAARTYACSVPVFRYALERWPVDPYEVIVFHRGDLTAEQKAVVDSLSPDGMAGKIFANVAVTTVNLDEDSDQAGCFGWRRNEADDRDQSGHDDPDD